MRSLLIILFITAGSALYAQRISFICDTSTLFPFKFGSSMFSVINQINVSKNLTPYTIGNSFSEPKKMMFLDSKDSVVYSYYSAKILSHPCLEARDGTMYFYFINDRLYRMEIKMYYDPSQYTTLKNKYATIISELQKKYYWNEMNYFNKDDLKHGEGYYFRPYEKLKDKVDQIELGYYFTYEYDIRQMRWTQNIREYTLKIDWYNFINIPNMKGF